MGNLFCAPSLTQYELRKRRLECLRSKYPNNDKINNKQTNKISEEINKSPQLENNFKIIVVDEVSNEHIYR